MRKTAKTCPRDMAEALEIVRQAARDCSVNAVRQVADRIFTSDERKQLEIEWEGHRVRIRGPFELRLRLDEAITRKFRKPAQRKAPGNDPEGPWLFEIDEPGRPA